MAATKIHPITSTAVRTLAYISNANKTENGLFVETYMCSKDPDEAEKDFLNTQKSIGTGRNKILAQHIIQSFKPDEVTAEQALEIGRKLCEKLLKDHYQYMLAVHTDKKHIHCHIVFNNVNMDNGKTFESLENRHGKAWEKLREISDDLCKEKGLSVIKEPEKNKGKSYYEWDMNRQGISWKSKLKFALDECIAQSDNFDDFLKKVREKNIEVVYNPEHKIDLKFRMDGQQKWSRARTLGWYYETPQIKKRIEQYKLFRSGEYGRRQRTRIIDTSTEKMRSNKGLERWANIQNMKEASRVINILTSQGLNNTDEIEGKSISNYNHRVSLVNSLNSLKYEIDDIDEVIKNLRIFKKYKPIHDEYSSLNSDRKRAKFEGQYHTELEKFRKAGTFLADKYPDKKLPKEENLQKKKTELTERRRSVEAEYTDIKQRIKDLDYARTAVQDYLKNERENGLSERKKNDDLE